VLETGRIVLSGKGQDLLQNPAIQAAYLGVRQRKEVVLRAA
jgi:ABC-type branched-subunit amino acid transport system ATPase component